MLHGARHEVADALVRGVEGGERGEGVCDGTEDQGWVACGESEAGVFLVDEGPGSVLGEGFGGAVAVYEALGGLFFGDGVPVDIELLDADEFFWGRGNFLFA